MGETTNTTDTKLTSRQADARLHTLLWPEQKVQWLDHRFGPGDTRKAPVYFNIPSSWWWDVPEYWETWAGAGLVIDRMRELGWRLSEMRELPTGNKSAVFMQPEAGAWFWREFEGTADDFPAAVAAAAEAALNAGKGETDGII